MHCIRGLARRVPFFAILISAFIVLSAPGAARADGPVDPESLPGGVTVTDGDPGAGEQWGRAGGRDIEYFVIDPGQFSALTWGIVNGTTPGAALDNAIDEAGENLTFNPGGSNLPGGVARWIGSADITLFGLQTGVYTLDTRFTLTVTDNLGAPVSLTFVAGEVNPGLDVINDTNGTFNANLLFEVFYPVGIPAGSMIGAGNNSWIPLLDLFDALDTDFSQDGFAHTSVNRGFYFTLDTSEPGLTLEQHDTTVHDKLDVIQGDTDFLRIEVPGRFMNVQDELAVIDQLIRNLPSTQIPPNLATQADVDDGADRVQEGLTQTLLTVLGILPFGGTVPDDIDFSKLPLSGVAEQDSVDMMSSNLDMVKTTLQGLVDDGLATQASVDALQAAINLLSTDGLATQASVDLLQVAVDGLVANVAAAISAAGLASQTSVDDLTGDVASVEGKVDAIQTTLANPDMGELHVEVVEITPRNYKDIREYLLLTTLHGEAVSAELNSAVAIILENGQAVAADTAVSSAAVVMGLGMIDVRVPARIGLKPARAYKFVLHYSDGGTGMAHASSMVVVDWPGEDGPPEHEIDVEDAPEVP